MKKFRFKSIILFYLIFLLYACRSQKPIEFILLEQNRYSGELNRNNSYFSAIYIVKNYSENKKSQAKIDSFAMDLGKKNQLGFDSYILSFYQESTITNLKNLKENPRDLDRYSDIKDHKLDYRWSGGSFAGKLKYRNGNMIKPKSTVRLSDAPNVKGVN